MTYSEEIKSKILNCIKLKKYTDAEIIEIFKISNGTYYKIKNGTDSKSTKNRSNSKSTRIRKTKITNEIEKYVIKYVTKRINFNYKKLISLILSKFNIEISKSTIYNILKKTKLRRKKFIKNQHHLIISFWKEK